MCVTCIYVKYIFMYVLHIYVYYIYVIYIYVPAHFRTENLFDSFKRLVKRIILVWYTSSVLVN